MAAVVAADQAELLPEHPALHLLDLPRLDVAELERPVGDPDQPADAEAAMFHDPPDLTVLALAQSDSQPGVGARRLAARHNHRAGFDSLEADALPAMRVLSSLPRP